MNINFFKESIVTGVNYLETKLKTLPEEGPFAKVSTQVPVEYDKLSLKVDLSIGAWKKPDVKSKINNWEKIRYVEMKVSSQDGKVDSSTWIYNGTNSDLTKIFQSKEKVISCIKNAFEQSIEHLEKDFELKV